MKLRVLATMAALPLLAGCGGSPSSDQSPVSMSEAVAVEQAAAPAPQEAAPIVLDLGRQLMVIPGTEHGTIEVPVLASGDVLAGPSVLIGEPADARPYIHCEDRTAGWAAEPDATSAGAWARAVQFVTFDKGCDQVSTISGHPVFVPHTVGIYDGVAGGVERWLGEGRQISVIGESPYPDPNRESLAGVDVAWPSDREVVVTEPSLTAKREAAVTSAAAKAAEAFTARHSVAVAR
ncbi:UNVERIFIED_ORG: hypothetical protein ABIB13_003216 [Arthrobacter sp. UYEF2]